jgi:general secretion pathway protein C
MMKRGTFLALLAAVAVLAAGLAFGINRILAGRIRPPDDAELVKMGADGGDGGDAVADAGADPAAPPDRGNRGGGKCDRPRSTPRFNLDSYMDPIMDRSLFDSSQVGATGGAIATAEGEEQEATDLGATLVLTMVATDPTLSSALIKLDQQDPYAEVFGVGDALADAEVETIIRRRVYLRRGNGALEYLEIGGETKKKGRSSTGSSDKKPARKKGRIDWSEGITKIDDTHYQVERDSLDNALANLDRLSRDARVVPNFVDGKSNGFKVFSIKRNSAYKHLGMQNNDVITGVNGMEITSPEKALDLYSKLQSESSISLDIIRKGQEMTMEYEIR